MDSGPQISAVGVIKLLLASGVDTNAQLNMRRPSNQGGRFNDPLLGAGTTPLLGALINNDADVARLLLGNGANPNIYGMGLSPWLYAAGMTSGTSNATRGGGSGGVGNGSATVDTALLDLMLAHGADVNAQVTGAASYSGRIARALTGDPVNTTSNEGMTALHVAVRSRNASVVRYLLDKGARPDIKDASGRTPLDVLNGVPAFQPAVFADAEGVVPPNANAAPAPAGAGRGEALAAAAAAIPRRFRRFGSCCRERRRTGPSRTIHGGLGCLKLADRASLAALATQKTRTFRRYADAAETVTCARFLRPADRR